MGCVRFKNEMLLLHSNHSLWVKSFRFYAARDIELFYNLRSDYCPDNRKGFYWLYLCSTLSFNGIIFLLGSQLFVCLSERNCLVTIVTANKPDGMCENGQNSRLCASESSLDVKCV